MTDQEASQRLYHILRVLKAIELQMEYRRLTRLENRAQFEALALVLEHQRLRHRQLVPRPGVIGEDTLTTRRAATLVVFAVTATLLVTVCYTDIGHSVVWFEHNHNCLTPGPHGLSITHKHGSDEISVDSYSYLPLASDPPSSEEECLDHAHPDWRADWGRPEERVLLIPEHADLPKDSVIIDYTFPPSATYFHPNVVHTHVCNTAEPGEVLFIPHTHSGDREFPIRRGPDDIREGDANDVEIECLNHAYPGGWRGLQP